MHQNLVLALLSLPCPFSASSRLPHLASLLPPARSWFFLHSPVSFCLLLHPPDAAASIPDCSSASRQAEQDQCLSYLSVGRKVFGSPQTLHYTVDAVSANDSNDIFVAWLPSRNIAGIPPIQVV
jgi:hypothetical protein